MSCCSPPTLLGLHGGCAPSCRPNRLWGPMRTTSSWYRGPSASPALAVLTEGAALGAAGQQSHQWQPPAPQGPAPGREADKRSSTGAGGRQGQEADDGTREAGGNVPRAQRPHSPAAWAAGPSRPRSSSEPSLLSTARRERVSSARGQAHHVDRHRPALLAVTWHGVRLVDAGPQLGRTPFTARLLSLASCNPPPPIHLRGSPSPRPTSRGLSCLKRAVCTLVPSQRPRA